LVPFKKRKEKGLLVSTNTLDFLYECE